MIKYLIIYQQCQTPYVGDGQLCTIDSDGDLYPDVALEINCTTENTEKYCIKLRIVN